MSRLLAVVCLAVVACLVGAASANACSIASPPGPQPKPSLRGDDVALFGKVLAVRKIDQQDDLPYGEHVARVRVWRLYKGHTRRTIRIRFNNDEAACGIALEEGDVVALRLDRPFAAGITSEVSLGYLKRATGGKWHRPRPS